MLSMAESVRQYLVQRLAEAPTPATAAQALGMGTRTLRRRLAEEGTSFRELHDQVRRTYAVELLESGLPPAMVARRLGYAGPAAFTHAFQRWHGIAPREFISRQARK
jgi:AraC-like DNA-binding protein